MDTLSEFAAVEREYYSGKDNNLFATSLDQAIRYYDFLQIIVERHHKANKIMVSKYTLLKESASTQEGGSMPEEQIQKWKELNLIDSHVQLEIESFFLFSKIFLDMIAKFILNYFGQARGIKLNSHDKLTKNYEKYGIEKGLNLPKQFGESLLFLKESVCDYRDKQISHLQNPRTVKATLFDMQGNTGIATMHMYPNARDTQIESTELKTIMDRIDNYVKLAIEVVKMNRAKTRFSLLGN